MSCDALARIATYACIAEMSRQGFLVLERVAVTRNAVHAVRYEDGVYKHYVLMEPREVVLVEANGYVGVYTIGGKPLSIIVGDGKLVFVRNGYDEVASASDEMIVLRVLRKKTLLVYRDSRNPAFPPAKLDYSFLEARGALEVIEAEPA